MFGESTNTPDFIRFLHQVKAACSERVGPTDLVYMVLDNASAHKGFKVRQVMSQLNIVPVFMPPYSPELNSIEFLWARMKRSIATLTNERMQISNAEITTLEELQYIATQALDLSEASAEQLLKSNWKELRIHLGKLV